MVKKLLSILVIATMVLSLFSVTAFAAETQKVEKVVFLQDFENVTAEQKGAGVYGELKGDWTEFNKNSTSTNTAIRQGNRRYAIGGATNQETTVKTEDGNSYLYATGQHRNYYAKLKVNLDNTVFEEGATYKLAMDVTYTLDNTYDKTKDSINIYMCGLKYTSTDDKALNNGLGKKTTTVKKDTPTTIYTDEFVYTAPDASVTGMELDNAEIGCGFRMMLTDASTFGTFTDSNSNGVRDDGEPLLYGKSSTEKFKIDNVRVIKIVDAAVADATADAGYYAETADGETKNGTIAFSSEITSGIDDATSYGIYVYRTDDNTKNDTVTVTDIDSLKEAEGKFSVVVEDIPEAHFGTNVCAKPFMIIGDTTVWANETIFSVNDAIKWLGNNQ